MDKFELANHITTKFSKVNSKQFKLKANGITNEVVMWIDHPHMYRIAISELINEMRECGWYIWYYRSWTYDCKKWWGVYNNLYVTDLLRSKKLKHLNLIIKQYDRDTNNK